MPFVLDASVALAWHFEDEQSEYADRVLDRVSNDEALVPSLWPLEVANGLLAAERRGRVTASDVAHAAELTLALSISLQSTSATTALQEALSLARVQDLSVYDAVYLELAMREGLALATLDMSLRRTAMRLGVRLVD